MVRFESFDGPFSSIRILAAPPPGSEAVLVGGLPAFFTRSAHALPNTSEGLSWTLSVPGNPEGTYQLDAGINGPGAVALEEQLLAMVSSIQYDPPVVPLISSPRAAADAAAAALT